MKNKVLIVTFLVPTIDGIGLQMLTIYLYSMVNRFNIYKKFAKLFNNS
ncbi:MAG: hypothetical protein SVN78_10310 [Deferribacterota bacterium]|nr:hypothetical protein [Deferribacterota bacterium]